MKFLPNFYILRDFQNVPFFNYLVIPKFYYGEYYIAQKLAEIPPKDIRSTSFPGLLAFVYQRSFDIFTARTMNEVDIGRFCVFLVTKQKSWADILFCRLVEMVRNYFTYKINLLENEEIHIYNHVHKLLGKLWKSILFRFSTSNVTFVLETIRPS